MQFAQLVTNTVVIFEKYLFVIRKKSVMGCISFSLILKDKVLNALFIYDCSLHNFASVHNQKDFKRNSFSMIPISLLTMATNNKVY